MPRASRRSNSRAERGSNRVDYGGACRRHQRCKLASAGNGDFNTSRICGSSRVAFIEYQKLSHGVRSATTNFIYLNDTVLMPLSHCGEHHWVYSVGRTRWQRLPNATADDLEHVGRLRRRIRAVLPAWARARAVNGHLLAPADQAAYGWAECVAVAPEGEAVCCTRN
jgi:hypothetical protein